MHQLNIVVKSITTERVNQIYLLHKNNHVIITLQKYLHFYIFLNKNTFIHQS